MEGQTLLIGIEEACKISGIGRNTMLELVKMDSFPAIKLKKRKILINREQFIAWINNLTSIV